MVRHMWSACCTSFLRQLNYGADKEVVCTNMLQSWMTVVSEYLVPKNGPVETTQETIPEPQPIQSVAVVRQSKKLITLGNPGGDTTENATERVSIVSQNVNSGNHNRRFKRGTDRTSDLTVTRVVKYWRKFIKQQPLRMEPPEWSSKTKDSKHNQFDWATEISQKPALENSEIIGKMGLHRCQTNVPVILMS